MINQTQETLFRLDNLNNEQQRISYQMSSGKKLKDGSDDAVLYAREIYVDDKIRVFEGIDAQLDKTVVHNNVSDSAVDEMKKLMEQIKSELLKANTSTTTDEGKKAIAVSIAGVKQNILDLANTKIDGEYVFSGSDSSVRPYIEDDSGNISYQGDNLLRKIAVEENSYREKGVNGFDVTMYSSDVATKGDTLSFSTSDRIIDQNGNEWKFIDVDDADGDGNILTGVDNTHLYKMDIDGNPVTDATSTPASPITGAALSYDATSDMYSFNVGTSAGTKFEAKTSIFDVIDNVVNALNKVDDAGDPISDTDASAALTANLAKVNASYDAMNVAHAELGGRNKVFELSAEKVTAKLTQYNILSQEIGAADLAKVAVEMKALELSYQVLYSTINKTNELSLVNFIN